MNQNWINCNREKEKEKKEKEISLISTITIKDNSSLWSIAANHIITDNSNLFSFLFELKPNIYQKSLQW